MDRGAQQPEEENYAETAETGEDALGGYGIASSGGLACSGSNVHEDSNLMAPMLPPNSARLAGSLAPTALSELSKNLARN